MRIFVEAQGIKAQIDMVNEDDRIKILIRDVGSGKACVKHLSYAELANSDKPIMHLRIYEALKEIVDLNQQESYLNTSVFMG